MKGVLLARDVRKLIVDRLNDATYGVNAYIATINTERTETTPTLHEIDAVSNNGNYPFMFIDLGDSTIEENIGADLTSLREVLQLECTVYMKDGNKVTLQEYGDNYIEAILRCLQSYVYQVNDGNFVCLATQTLRAELDTEQEQTIRGVAVLFNVHRNKL